MKIFTKIRGFFKERLVNIKTIYGVGVSLLGFAIYQALPIDLSLKIAPFVIGGIGGIVLGLILDKDKNDR